MTHSLEDILKTEGVAAANAFFDAAVFGQAFIRLNRQDRYGLPRDRVEISKGDQGYDLVITVNSASQYDQAEQVLADLLDTRPPRRRPLNCGIVLNYR